MGKLDVAILRYLTAEDFRVLTAVRNFLVLSYADNVSNLNFCMPTIGLYECF